MSSCPNEGCSTISDAQGRFLFNVMHTRVVTPVCAYLVSVAEPNTCENTHTSRRSLAIKQMVYMLVRATTLMSENMIGNFRHPTRMHTLQFNSVAMRRWCSEGPRPKPDAGCNLTLQHYAKSRYSATQVMIYVHSSCKIKLETWHAQSHNLTNCVIV